MNLKNCRQSKVVNQFLLHLVSVTLVFGFLLLIVISYFCEWGDAFAELLAILIVFIFIGCIIFGIIFIFIITVLDLIKKWKKLNE